MEQKVVLWTYHTKYDLITLNVVVRINHTKNRLITRNADLWTYLTKNELITLNVVVRTNNTKNELIKERRKH